MMTYGTKSDKRKRLKGEVFTPPGVVFYMVMNVNEYLPDMRKKFFDPCVGEGQFPCAELVLKMFYSVDKLNEKKALTILSSIFGMDIQSDNVDQARANMLNTFCDAYKYFTGEEISEPTLDKAILTIAHNFQVGDSLEVMKAQVERQQTLIDWR